MQIGWGGFLKLRVTFWSSYTKHAVPRADAGSNFEEMRTAQAE